MKQLNILYRYRPLSEFLFKELYYQELYFASYNELNGPLDLCARIEFTSKGKETIEYLIWFIFKIQFDFDELKNSKKNNSKLLKFNKDEKARNSLRDEIIENVNKTLKKKELIRTDDIINSCIM